MDDDFNTAQALGVLFDAVRTCNRFVAEANNSCPAALSLIARTRRIFAEIGEVLGLFNSSPAAWLEQIKNSKADRIDLSPRRRSRG